MRRPSDTARELVGMVLFALPVLVGIAFESYLPQSLTTRSGRAGWAMWAENVVLAGVCLAWLMVALWLGGQLTNWVWGRTAVPSLRSGERVSETTTGASVGRASPLPGPPPEYRERG